MTNIDRSTFGAYEQLRSDLFAVLLSGNHKLDFAADNSTEIMCQIIADSLLVVALHPHDPETIAAVMADARKMVTDAAQCRSVGKSTGRAK